MPRLHPGNSTSRWDGQVPAHSGKILLFPSLLTAICLGTFFPGFVTLRRHEMGTGHCVGDHRRISGDRGYRVLHRPDSCVAELHPGAPSRFWPLPQARGGRFVDCCRCIGGGRSTGGPLPPGRRSRSAGVCVDRRPATGEAADRGAPGLSIGLQVLRRESGRPPPSLVDCVSVATVASGLRGSIGREVTFAH